MKNKTNCSATFHVDVSDGQRIIQDWIGPFGRNKCSFSPNDNAGPHVELEALIRAMDGLREEEQRRLARELHDDLGQLLATLKIDLSALRQALPSCGKQVDEQLDRLHNLSDAMSSSVRRIIADLPPKDLAELGLGPAVEKMCERFSNRHGVRCKIHFSLCTSTLANHIAATIYRLVQESLNNVAKHANANEVTVRLMQQGPHALLSVADNGSGIAPSKETQQSSFGLIGMQERVAALGGHLSITSRLEGGTIITAKIPLTRDAALIHRPHL